MVPGADIMHGEAVNVDGFLSLVIAKRRGMISNAVLQRVFSVMKTIGLPTIHDGVELKQMEKVKSFSTVIRVPMWRRAAVHLFDDVRVFGSVGCIFLVGGCRTVVVVMLAAGSLPLSQEPPSRTVPGLTAYSLSMLKSPFYS